MMLRPELRPEAPTLTEVADLHLWLRDLVRRPEGEVRLYVGGRLISGTTVGSVTTAIAALLAQAEQGVIAANAQHDALREEYDEVRLERDLKAGDLAAMTAERDALAAQVARGRALADEWDATVYTLPPDYPMTTDEFCRLWFKGPLRAALSPAEATEGGEGA